MDFALTLADELPIWAPDCSQIVFPEPNPLFYENAPWGVTTRRDRLLTLITLASHSIPGTPKAIRGPHHHCPGPGRHVSHPAAA